MIYVLCVGGGWAGGGGGRGGGWWWWVEGNYHSTLITQPLLIGCGGKREVFPALSIFAIWPLQCLNGNGKISSTSSVSLLLDPAAATGFHFKKFSHCAEIALLVPCQDI